MQKNPIIVVRSTRDLSIFKPTKIHEIDKFV
jgi:hypothetical protein